MSKLSRRDLKFTFVQYQFGQILHNYCKVTNSLFRQKLKTYYWSHDKKIHTLVVVANEKQRLIKLQRGLEERKDLQCAEQCHCAVQGVDWLDSFQFQSLDTVIARSYPSDALLKNQVSTQINCPCYRCLSQIPATSHPPP